MFLVLTNVSCVEKGVIDKRLVRYIIIRTILNTMRCV